MRRDRTPLIAAGTTAIVSCGLLAVSIWRGWLGPDVGRGDSFCEAARDSLIRQPANTLSNLGFVVAGLLVGWHAGRPGNVGSRLRQYRHLPAVMASIVVFLGPASAAMHATQSALGGRLDMLSMYLIASLALAYATIRFLRAGVGVFAAAFAGGVLLCELVGELGGPVPVVMSSGNAVFGALLLTAAGLELRIMRRGDARSRHTFAYASIGSLAVAFVIWNATQDWLCAPYSPVQGHAIWHILDAVAAYLLYRYYASEDDASEHDASEVDASEEVGSGGAPVGELGQPAEAVDADR